MLPALFRHGEVDAKGFAVLPLLEAAQRAIEGDTTSRNNEVYLMMLLAAQGAFLRSGYSLRAQVMPDAPGPEFGDDIERAWSMACSRSSWEALGFWGVLLATEYAWTAPDADAGMQQLRRLIGELRRAGQRWDLAFALQSLGRIMFIRLPVIDPSQSLDEALGYLRETLAISRRSATHVSAATHYERSAVCICCSSGCPRQGTISGPPHTDWLRSMTGRMFAASIGILPM